jgi:hypothetical protein
MNTLRQHAVRNVSLIDQFYNRNWKAIKNDVVTLLGVDLRSLALWRVLIACVLLIDIYQRFNDLYAHYTDYGTARSFL